METSDCGRSDAQDDQTEWMSRDEIAYWERVMQDSGMRARHPSSKRAQAIRGFLHCYARDPRFTRECMAFYRGHRIALTVFQNLTDNRVYEWERCGYRLDWRMPRYWGELDAFIKRWELGLFDGVQDHIHFWLFLKRQGKAQWGGPELREADISTIFDEFIPQMPSSPPIGEVVLSCKSGRFGREITTTDVHVPILHVAFDSQWDPAVESRASQKAWMMQQCDQIIDAELKRVTDKAVLLGYEFPDKPHAFDLHMQWLYKRIAYRESCDVISAHTPRPEHLLGYNAQSIQKATKDLADEMGITIPRPRARRKF